MIPMTNDKRDLLAVLKAELEFLEKGGYRHTARAPWRPQFLFQDSPTCLNFDPSQQPGPCSDCVLMQVVPGDQQGKKIPCRYVPLNDQGETIDSFYRYGTPEELEAAAGQWLRTTIQHFEKENTESTAATESTEVHVNTRAVPRAILSIPT